VRNVVCIFAEEHKIVVLENNVLKIISGPNTEQLIGKFRIMFNAELHQEMLYGY